MSSVRVVSIPSDGGISLAASHSYTADFPWEDDSGQYVRMGADSNTGPVSTADFWSDENLSGKRRSMLIDLCAGGSSSVYRTRVKVTQDSAYLSADVASYTLPAEAGSSVDLSFTSTVSSLGIITIESSDTSLYTVSNRRQGGRVVTVTVTAVKSWSSTTTTGNAAVITASVHGVGGKVTLSAVTYVRQAPRTFRGYVGVSSSVNSYTSSSFSFDQQSTSSPVEVPVSISDGSTCSYVFNSVSIVEQWGDGETLVPISSFASRITLSAYGPFTDFQSPTTSVSLVGDDIHTTWNSLDLTSNAAPSVSGYVVVAVSLDDKLLGTLRSFEFTRSANRPVSTYGALAYRLRYSQAGVIASELSAEATTTSNDGGTPQYFEFYRHETVTYTSGTVLTRDALVAMDPSKGGAVSLSSDMLKDGYTTFRSAGASVPYSQWDVWNPDRTPFIGPRYYASGLTAIAPGGAAISGSARNLTRAAGLFSSTVPYSVYFVFGRWPSGVPTSTQLDVYYKLTSSDDSATTDYVYLQSIFFGVQPGSDNYWVSIPGGPTSLLIQALSSTQLGSRPVQYGDAIGFNLRLFGQGHGFFSGTGSNYPWKLIQHDGVGSSLSNPFYMIYE